MNNLYSFVNYHLMAETMAVAVALRLHSLVGYVYDHI